MKQTAVEWLANRIIALEERLRLKEIDLYDFIEEKDLLVEQAKEIENEQKSDLITSFEEWRKKHPLVSLEEPEWQLKKFLASIITPNNK